MKLGNLLYLGYWAFEGESDGQSRFILEHPSAAAMRSIFPTSVEGSLFIQRKDVKMTYRRSMPWSSGGSEQRQPEKFDPPLLDEYISTRLLPGSAVSVPPSIDLDDALVVNVRRGDYFTVPSIQAEFGIDTVGYTLEAVRQAVEASSVPKQIYVVSDGTQWCRENLMEPLSRFAPVTVLDNDPSRDLSMVVHAQWLVIPNSTFSYWGGYIGDTLYPGREVFAPWLFNRSEEGGRAAHQLRPSWHVVESIPRGWDVTGP